MPRDIHYCPGIIRSGDLFDTPFESGCIATTDSDDLGSFDALDSDDVLCRFSVVMVSEIEVNGRMVDWKSV